VSEGGTALGMLLVQMEPIPAMEDEFQAWYDTEHVPEREAIPSFLSAVRWVCLDGFPRYMACYDLTTPAVLREEPYTLVGGANSSVWTKRVLSRVIGYERLVFRQADPGGMVEPQNGKVLIRVARPDSAAVLEAAGALAKEAPEASVRVFENALTAIDCWIMLDAPSLALIPELSPTKLRQALGDLTGDVVDVWRYQRYWRWT
jgi:hypothetical protein